MRTERSDPQLGRVLVGEGDHPRGAARESDRVAEAALPRDVEDGVDLARARDLMDLCWPA